MTKKQEEKISVMREGGLFLSKIMAEAVNYAGVGLTTADLEKYIRSRFSFYGVLPSFTTVRNYQDYSCLCVNDVVVHGVPSSYVLKHNDIIGIDIGVFFKGYHTDMSWSKVILDPDSKIQDGLKQNHAFLATGAKTLVSAIKACKAGNRIGDISSAIQANIEKNGYSGVRQLVGHAVGKKLHEHPQIPGIITEDIQKTPELTPGLTLAIEVIYCQGKPEIVYKNDDGWSIATRDKSFSGLFEATVAVEDTETEILTPIEGLLKRQFSGIIDSYLT